ncbi:PEP/pyruvate-binding domain-containing protein [Endozoicomonas sp. 8E]|uniref:PEP/pyruvate-binding domain-containing protein n=1 Tax=Endozoicomonas sp. 8E TaxID=3035692 RepID=UPI002939307D|nr:PEP/pyruvate-binding domain-containing protein [Endozoicomonas sp. 8E]WOG25670.1 PEP/pyruvate-binding domain-containing protein [Endozoicomonas sp. 8E]
MLPLPPAKIGRSDSQSLATVPDQNTKAYSSAKRYFGDPEPVVIPDTRLLARRKCHSPVADQAAHCSVANRALLGGKGMFLQRMKAAGLSVPPFQCVTTQVTNALEQHPLDSQHLEPYFPGIGDEPEAEISLANIRKRLNTLLPSEQTRRDSWLAGLANFIASDDFYEQVKDSEAARHIRDHGLSTSGPLIVRSSGINEDNFGDAQAGKYLSEVQGDEDILRTCLKVMASAYRPEVCSEGVPQPMALIIQECIHCLHGGVAMSFQSFDDDTLRVEFTHGQPRGVVAGQSGNTPHRIDLFRKEGADSYQYFPGTISSHYILRKNNNGYSETRIDDADAQSNDVEQQLTDDMIADLRQMVTKLEKLLLCPVDVEFAINNQGRLFLLQVRPVTRLSGGLDFAMPIPEETLGIGEGVSEGYCTGPLWLAEESAADSMPEGAIVVARHAQDWMLEPGFLKRAGGFVTATGGFNDHVAILMKQQRKTLMLAGDQFEAVTAQVGQQATLACARFNGKPGAFIVAGDMTGKLVSHGSLSSAVADLPSANAVPSWDDLSFSEDALRQVASGFQWLTDQNARLLAFFATGGGLDCLANPVKLSMSPQRSKLLAETLDSVNRLVHGAQALLDGYGAFLQLAVKRSSDKVKSLRHELPQLIDRFEMLKKTIQSGLERIALPMQAAEEEKLSPVTFRQWLADCHQLQSCLQALNPGEAEQVRSVHELIFALHQRFVEALAPVTLASGQGRHSRKDLITYVDCTVPGNPDEKSSLLNLSCTTSIQALRCSGTVITMDEAVILNLQLGSHMSLIELLERAEGGKGRTLRLTFSDQFDFDGDGEKDKSHKFTRMWFLAQLLKEIKLDKNAGTMKLSCNAVAGEMIVECPQMISPETMQHAFKNLLIVLRAMRDLDLDLMGITTFEGGRWDFNLLAQRLNRNIATEADRFAFQHCLFVMSSRNKSDWLYTADCCRILSKHHQQFAHYAHRLAMWQFSLRCWEKPEETAQEILMSDEMNEDTRRELLHHLLLFSPIRATELVEQVYDMGDQCFVINPSRNYRLEFRVPPGQPLGDHKEEIRNAVLKHGLKYASQRVRNDKNFVLSAISEYPEELRFLSEKLRDDSDVIMAAVAKEPRTLHYASERLRGDKDIVRMITANSICHLTEVSKELLSDRQYMLELIAINPLAFSFAVPDLKYENAFINAAKRRNPEVRKYLRESANEV